MGFKISWTGFHGVMKDQVLAKLGLRDTEEHDVVNESPFSGAEIAGVNGRRGRLTVNINCPLRLAR